MKKFHRLLSWLMVITILTGMLPAGAVDFDAPEREITPIGSRLPQDAEPMSATISTDEITEIIENYWNTVTSNGTKAAYWNAKTSEATLKSQAANGDYLSSVTYSPCPNHDGGCTSNTFCGGKQCYGFAAYMVYLATGINNASNTGEYYHEVDSSFVFQPGDRIWYDWGKGEPSHALFVYKVVGDTVYFIESNWGGRCHINLRSASMTEVRGYINKHNNSSTPWDYVWRPYCVYSPDTPDTPTKPTPSEGLAAMTAPHKGYTSIMDLEEKYYEGATLTSLDFTGSSSLDYGLARPQEKLLGQAVSFGIYTGNSQDLAGNFIKYGYGEGGEQQNRVFTGKDGQQYSITAYVNDNGAHIQSNSIISFTSESNFTDSEYGQLVYVEEVVEIGGEKYIYYTYGNDSCTSWPVLQMTFNEFYNGGAGYAGTVVFYNLSGIQTPYDLGTCGDNLTWSLSTDGVLTISGTGAMYDFEQEGMPWGDYSEMITSLVIHEGVTTIGNNAFIYCGNLVSVMLPDSLTSIGDLVFQYCSSLTYITIPAGVTHIGWGVFSNCPWLDHITVDAGNTAYCSVDGVLFSKDMTQLIRFPENQGISTYTIPDGVSYIGGVSFLGCSLMSLYIPASVTYIGSYALTDCLSLSTVYYAGTETQWSEIVIESGNDSLMSAQIICTGIEEPELPDGIVATGTCGDNLTWSLSTDGVLTISGTGDMTYYYSATDAPWYDYRDSVTSVTIENGVTSIGGSAFYGCSNMSSVSIANTVTSIGQAAFEYCSALHDVEIPEGVNVIGATAFGWCTGLTAVTLPASMLDFDATAFQGCTGLHSIHVAEGNSLFTSIDGVVFNTEFTVLVRVPNGRTGSYSVPDGVTHIEQKAFEECDITSVTIPVSVTAIGDNAFRYCDFLATVYYGGTEAQWNSITIGSGNDSLLNAEIIFADSGEDPIVPGDVNGDGKVTGADTNLIFRYVSGLIEFTDEQLAAADINGDGKVSGADTNLVFRFVSGMIDSLG